MTSSALEALLPYYRGELTYLRRMGAAFAQQYPKVASRLELGGGESPDPHVERLLESFAFLTGRIQYNLESEFPRITTALLDLLYPQLLQPVPSMAVVHCEVDPEQGKPTSGFRLARHTPLVTRAEDGQLCRFRTACEATLWPFEVTEAAFDAPDAFELLGGGNVASALRLRLRCMQGTFADYDLSTLRFHLAGDPAVASQVYRLLFSRLWRAAVLPEGSAFPTFLPAGAVTAVGFAPDEAVLPYPPHAHAGYRLLQEYFTFPDKFLFFDLHHLDAHRAGDTLDLLFLFTEVPEDRLAVGPHHFLLNCTPVVNLFPRVTEPIRLDQQQFEYRLVPDRRRYASTEIHSIQKLTTALDGAAAETIEPYFSFDHTGSERRVYWYAQRRPPDEPRTRGTDMVVTFTDLNAHPAQPPVPAVFAHTLCTNRHLADDLHEGAVFEEVSAPVRRIYALRKPTLQVDPPLGGATLWRLISHLSLNHLSLGQGRESLAALREILGLYSLYRRADVAQQIAGIRDMQTRSVVHRLGTEAWRGFCRGTEVTLVFDERHYVGSSAFLFATVLHHFLGLYASVNTFTQLAARGIQRDEVWKRWEPLAGAQTIL